MGKEHWGTIFVVAAVVVLSILVASDVDDQEAAGDFTRRGEITPEIRQALNASPGDAEALRARAQRVDELLDPQRPAPNLNTDEVASLDDSDWMREGSPLALLPMTEAFKYRATPANLRSWMKSVPELEGLAFGWNAEIEYLWGLCQEHRALDAFVGGHQKRAFEMWRDYRAPPSLRAELEPVREFLSAHLDDGGKFWRLVVSYDSQVHSKLIEEGHDMPGSDSAQSKWPLHVAMVEAREAAFLSLVETLKGTQ